MVNKPSFFSYLVLLWWKLEVLEMVDTVEVLLVEMKYHGVYPEEELSDY